MGAYHVESWAGDRPYPPASKLRYTDENGHTDYGVYFPLGMIVDVGPAPGQLVSSTEALDEQDMIKVPLSTSRRLC